MNNFFRQIRISFQLSKPIISLAVALSAFTAYVISEHRIDLSALFLITGVYSFSGAAAILNQIQEQKYDALMERTRNRPIPSKTISVQKAIFTFVCHVIVGSILLLFGNNIYVFLWALLTLLIYNLIYTPLKRITTFSIIIGAIVGALPPLIGWAATESNFMDWRIWMLSGFFFMGQIPHFGMLSLKYGHEYKAAGYPVINDYLSNYQIKHLSFVWIMATGLTALMISFQSAYLYYLVLLGFVYLALSAFRWIRIDNPKTVVGKIFFKLNLFFLLVMLILCIQVFL